MTWRWPWSRLAARIYLAGLAQFVAVIAGFVVLVQIGRWTEVHRQQDAVERIASKLEDPDALAKELEDVRTRLDAIVVIYDDRGQVLASNRHPGDELLPGVLPPPPPGLPPLGPPPRRRVGPPPGRPPDGPPGPRHPPAPSGGFFHMGPPPMLGFVLPVRLPDGREGKAVYTSRSPHAPRDHSLLIVSLVLIVVGVASLLTARSIARPLSRLTQAARAFGAGKLEARVELPRKGEIGEVAAAFDDMAERIALLLRAERELLANVSHELRTPLARIRVAVDLATEGDADVAREALSEVSEDLAELDRIIGAILTAARLDLGGLEASGLPPMQREDLDPAAILERAAFRFRTAHAQRPLLATWSQELPLVQGDAVLLRRAIDNLLENAHKYSRGAGDPVELQAVVDGGALRIEIRDRGIGIAAADLPLVFRPFFRTDRSRTRATGGLGLGLALTRRIVEAHGGHVELASTVDQGTTATITLPLAPDRRSPGPAESVPSAQRTIADR